MGKWVLSNQSAHTAAQPVQMGWLPCPPGDSEAWQGPAHYGGRTQYMAALQEIKGPACSRVRRKRTVAIKRLIKRDSAGTLDLGLTIQAGGASK